MLILKNKEFSDYIYKNFHVDKSVNSIHFGIGNIEFFVIKYGKKFEVTFSYFTSSRYWRYFRIKNKKTGKYEFLHTFDNENDLFDFVKKINNYRAIKWLTLG